MTACNDCASTTDVQWHGDLHVSTLRCRRCRLEVEETEEGHMAQHDNKLFRRFGSASSAERHRALWCASKKGSLNWRIRRYRNLARNAS